MISVCLSVATHREISLFLAVDYELCFLIPWRLHGNGSKSSGVRAGSEETQQQSNADALGPCRLTFTFKHDGGKGRVY